MGVFMHARPLRASAALSPSWMSLCKVLPIQGLTFSIGADDCTLPYILAYTCRSAQERILQGCRSRRLSRWLAVIVPGTIACGMVAVGPSWAANNSPGDLHMVSACVCHSGAVSLDM